MLKKQWRDVTEMFSTFYSADRKCACSLFSLWLVILADLEVSQLICHLIGCYHSQPITEVVLLQVLLGEVLQVPVERWGWFPRMLFVYILSCQCQTLPYLFENCFSDVTLILFFMRPTWTMFPRFPVFPLTLILSLRKVSCWTEHSDVLGKRALVQTHG